MAEATEPLRVIIVEDSEDDVALILRQLRRGGYDPIHIRVETAGELTAALEEGVWDIVISDYSLPQFSGLAAIEVCAKRGFEIPFILVSGTVGEEEAVQAMKAGAHDYLMKDNLPRLAPAVRRELREAQARRERLRAEARLASILATAADAIIGVDEGQNIVFFNQGAEEIFGYATSEILGKSLDLLLPRLSGEAGAEEKFSLSAERAVSGQQQTEVIGRRKGGGEFPAEVSVSEFSQDDGNYFTVILRDITGRKEAEVALQEANRRAIRQYEQLLQRLIKLAQAFGAAQDLETVYRALASFVEESAPCNGLFIALYDPDTQLRTCVYAGGDTEEDVSQLPPMPLNDSPQSRAIVSRDVVVVDDYQAAVAGLSPVNLGMETDPRLPQSAVAMPMSVMGRIIGVFEVQSVEPAAYKQEHVTALRMAASLAAVAIEVSRLLEQIQAQADQLQTVIDTVPDGVLLIDARHRPILVNPVAREYLPLLAKADRAGKLNRLGDWPLPEILQPVDGGGAGARIELKVDEPESVYEVAAKPVAQGTEVGWVIVLRDVTEERRRQEHLRRQERLATVGQLAAGIAHDFNNVMAIIMLYSETLTRAPDHAKRMFYLETIREQAGHAASLISQILDFSRRSVMERTRLDLLVLIKESVKLLKRTLPENISILLDAKDGPPDQYVSEADPTRLRQMLMNLAINARDAMPEGGEMRIVLDRLSVEPDRSPLPEMRSGAWIALAVHDTGIGVSEEAMPHLFEPFFTTKEPGSGTGLGLAQVYGIVKQHGGEIGVESQEGRGTTFTVYLPALEEEEAERESAGEAIHDPGQTSGTVLLVEDDDTTRKAIHETLELLGYRVLTATNGQDALDTLEQQLDDIDLVLTDMIMPEMGGLAFYETLKVWQPDVHVVVMTGYPLADVGRRALEQGELTWIQKPFSMTELAQLVRKKLATE